MKRAPLSAANTQRGRHQARLRVSGLTDLLSHIRSFLSSRKGDILKIFLKLPGGAEFRFERDRRPPMDNERFGAVCGLLACALAALVLVVLIVAVTSR